MFRPMIPAWNRVALRPATCAIFVLLVFLACGDDGVTPPPDTRVFVDDDNATGTADGSRDHPFKTIQEGITAAGAGGHVYVLSGLYAETVEIAFAGLTLEGESNATSVVDASGAPTAILIGAHEVTVRNLQVRSASRRGIFLQGANRGRIISNRIHAISAPPGERACGIQVESASDNRIESNEICEVISRQGPGMPPDNTGGGIVLVTAPRNEVLSNRIHHVTATTAHVAGIFGYSSAHLVLGANEVHDTSTSGSPWDGSMSTGLRVVDSDSVRIHDNLIHDIRSTTHYANGIRGERCSALQVARNSVSHVSGPWENEGFVMYWDAPVGNSGVVIEENEVQYIDSPGGRAIVVLNADALVRKNRIRKCGVGVHIWMSVPSFGATIRDNSIFSSWNYGIGLDGSRNRVEGNSIENCNMAIRFEDSGDGENLIFHNNFMNNTTQFASGGAGSNMWYEPVFLEGNHWSDYPGADDGSGSGKHAIAGDGIGDTVLPWPSPGGDMYPYMRPNGWKE